MTGLSASPVALRRNGFKRLVVAGLIAFMGSGAGTALAQGQASGGSLPAELARAWAQTKLPQSALSLVVEELDGPRSVALNAAAPRNPASVMKLVTTYAALEGLGPAYTWQTQLLTHPANLPGADGRLRGPLYLKAGGDPSLQMQDLWSLLRDLRLRGVTHIPELIVDRSIFGDVGIDPGAFDGDPARPYNASPDAWMVGFGAVRLMFQPDANARRWIVTSDPPLPGVQVGGAPIWSDAPCPGSPVVQASPVIDGRGVTLQLTGTVSGDCGPFDLYRLALPQAEHANAVLQALWTEMGGTFDGPVRNGTLPPGLTPLATHNSPTLAEVIRDINKRSNNVMARQLLLTLGAASVQSGATPREGAVATQAVLRMRGLDFPELVIDNGSGLSRNGQVSANSLALLLTSAWRSPAMPEFMSSLAIAGTDGTVRRRLRSGPAAGSAHLKTGSLRDVRAVAGYVLGASGKRYLVVSMVNDEEAGRASPFHDALIAWLAAR